VKGSPEKQYSIRNRYSACAAWTQNEANSLERSGLKSIGRIEKTMERLTMVTPKSGVEDLHAPVKLWRTSLAG
jgi:hypothetical protein